jgi:signal transduction histidine kinase/CheY-like chemotaxis protein
MLVLQQIIENLLLLSFMGIVFFFVQRHRSSLGTLKADLLHGLSLGLTAALVTTVPVTLGDGATIDARAGPVILAGVIAGPIGGLLAASMGGMARGLIGGSFAVSGIAVYGVYALIGVAIRYFHIIDTRSFLKPRSIAIVVLASIAGASAMFFLISPTSRAILWLQNDLPLILVANTLSVTYAAVMLGFATVFLQKSAEIIELNETLNLAKRAGRFGVWDFDISSGKLVWDERSKALHGVTDSAFQGVFEDWSRNVHPDDLPQTEEAFAQALANNKIFDTEYRVLLPDGTQKSIKGDALVLRDSAGNATRVVGTNLDLTDIRTAEAKLAEARSVAIQAQKFETIGQLTGGVAHDFNNLLAVIMGNLEMLKHELQTEAFDREETSKLIEVSIDATVRGAELTQNMLAYARKAQLMPVLVDLNQVVRETEKWVRRTIESRIEIETVLQAGLWPILADKSSLQSAMVNLLVNARDACAGPGRVTVETSNIRVDEKHVDASYEDILPGSYVMLAVTDNGVGMEQEVVDRIFDPFFTTKSVGKGTGLGLSMVQGFVKQSQGSIKVDSQPGEGTSFKLYFPAASNASIEVHTTNPNDSNAAIKEKSSGRILLVEDEQDVRDALQKILTTAGYDVTTAASGDEALSLFMRDDQFDLITTDITMPGLLQGPSLARKIRKMRPEKRFIFLSGYASEATTHRDNLTTDDIRLMKPISQSDLLHAIAKCLSIQS